jgi:flagellar hook-length control protein FliK
MNNPLQASRASTSLPTGTSIKSAASKDTRSGAAFAAFLSSQIKKDQERKAEECRSDECDATDEVREPAEKPDEVSRSQSPVRTPIESLMVVANQSAPKPVEPPPADGGSKQPCDEKSSADAGRVDAAKACTTNGTSAAGQAAGTKASDQPAADDTAAQAATTAEGTSTAAADASASALPSAPKNSAAGQAAATFNTVPDISTAANSADLTDLQVPSAAKQDPQTKESETKSSNHPNPAPTQTPNPSANAGAEAATPAAANPAQTTALKTPPDQAKTTADTAETAKVQVQVQAKAAAAGAPQEVQAALGGTTSVTTTPLQTLEPARLAEAQNKGMIWQVCQNVENMLKNRQTSLRLMLYPEDMGRIDLRLSSSSAGMSVSMVAQQASTGQMLESQLAQLRQSLDQAGIHLASLSVGQQHSQAGSGQTSRQSRDSSSAPAQNQTVQPLVEERIGVNSLEPSEGYDYLA